MKLLQKVSFTLFFIIAIGELLIALRFFLSTRIMPYHLDAMGTTWDLLTPGTQIMTLNFMRAAGLGFFMTGIMLLFLLLFPFKKSEKWSNWALLIISLTHVVIMMVIILNIKINTPANPPVVPFILFGCLAISGFIINCFNVKNNTRRKL